MYFKHSNFGPCNFYSMPNIFIEHNAAVYCVLIQWRFISSKKVRRHGLILLTEHTKCIFSVRLHGKKLEGKSEVAGHSPSWQEYRSSGEKQFFQREPSPNSQHLATIWFLKVSLPVTGSISFIRSSVMNDKSNPIASLLCETLMQNTSNCGTQLRNYARWRHETYF